MVLLLFTVSGSILQAQTAFYVAPSAIASGDGTLANPYSSIQNAIDQTRELENVSITIYLRGGRYEISEPLRFDEKTAGQSGNKIILKAYKNEKPVISGGVKVTGWEKVNGNIYKASLDRSTKLRSLFVNGKRKRMAGTDVPVNGVGDWGRFEINGNEPWAFGAGSGIEGISFASSDVDVYNNADDIEVIQFNTWTEKILCVESIEKVKDLTVFNLQQPYGAIATSMAWAGKINYERTFVIRNAFELLDQPGEFYFDKTAKTLYYYSDNENMKRAEVIAPTSDGLVQIVGKSNEVQAGNLSFEGITFSHDDWQLMDVAGSKGFAGIQSLGLAIKYIPNGNWHPSAYNSTDVPRGSIQILNAKNICFERNKFELLGSAIAINMVNDVSNVMVNANVFQNTLGNAVSVGHPQHYKIGDGPKMEPRTEEDQIHLTEIKASKYGRMHTGNGLNGIYAVGEEGLCTDITISNNYIRNVSLGFRQVEGITAFFVENVVITHNDIAGTPYGAITCGWWWGNAEIPPSTVARDNEISYNKAGDTHQALDDGGIIYVLGEQPNSYIEKNYVFNGPRCIYPDDGSAYWTIRDNVVGNPSYKHMWLHFWTKRCHDNVAYRNYVKNHFYMDNGTDNLVEQTYSFREEDFSSNPLAQRIIDEAGILPAFADIIPEKEPEPVRIFPAEFKEADKFH
ncbi:MAG: right-handed parallel beta-helix repeat-containing protein [Cyclobacteriaceae bacterium]